VRAVNSTSAGRQSLVTLMAGRSVGGTRLRADQGLLVQANGQNWLLWRNMRMRVSQFALTTFNGTPAAISAKWLDSVSQGPDYAGPSLPAMGRAAQGPLGPARVGQVFSVNTSSGTGSSFVLLADGLAQITPIQRDLILADPRTRTAAYANQAPQAIAVDAGRVNSVPRSQRQVLDNRLSGKAPVIAQYQDTSALCAVYDDPSGNSDAKLAIGGTLPAPPGGAQPVGADQLVFPPGSAAVAGRVPSPGKANEVNTYYLVAEGKRFVIKDNETAQSLGYQIPGNAAKVPAGVLDLIAQGPTLDPAAVSNTVQ
jgi:type VII secretion protein EccB